MTREKFFGRELYLDMLDKRVTSLKDGYRQNIALIGDELVGKTAVLHHFLDSFCDNRIIAVYLEVRPESLEVFAKRFIGVLLYNFLINSGEEMREDLAFLVRASEKYIPKTAGKVKAILAALERRKKNNIFIELLSLLESVNHETGKFCVAIFDEFHNLENLGIKNLYPEWSKLLITQKNTMYIIISSMKQKAKAILSKNLSLLFGNFQVLTMEPFDIKTSGGYLKARLTGLELPAGIRNFIIHFTGGNPFYLGLISAELLKAGKDGPAPADVLEDLLFRPAGILNQKFSNYLKRFMDIPHSQDYTSILYLISEGHNKLNDIAHILRKQKKELAQRVNHLIELDTVSRNGDFLKVNDRVFGFWLRFVYQEKMKSLTFDSRNQNVIFREKIESMIREFLSDAGKSLVERTMEVMHLFTDDTVHLETRRLRLTHFREIKAMEFDNQRIHEAVIARSHDDLWIIAFKRGVLTEEDITDFTRECRKYRHKLQKKIIVSLEDIDANTRLRALEEKVWTWDLNSLNQLFDLFHRSRIISGEKSVTV
ncbi:MAG: ATP-binding protein [Candidatus Omnitrophica bacterium]|nr:ATP-binding protein [Candidatus Omnitrophota bacterium]MDD5552760.1 ATP-binding protein [Candidatus Omnitrophota bacterium]